MKIKLHKYFRLALIILSIVIFSVATVMLYRELNVPKFVEKKVVLYSSSHKTDVNYQVFLKPNILYDKNNLGEGQVYLTELVDYIQTNFEYQFTGNANAEVMGDYDVIAVVEGYTSENEGEEKKIKTIWKKEFIFVPKTEFKIKNKKITIEKEIPLKLEQYNTFSEQVKEVSKVNVPVKLSLFMNINSKVSTDKGDIVEKFIPQLMIPLGTSNFEIIKSGVEERPGIIDETKKTQLPPNGTMINLYAAILGFMIIILLYLALYISVAPQIDPLVKQLNKIFKKHGSRLVALNNEIAVTCETYSKVKSIDDLVRIADEIGKPIMYQYDLDSKNITQFYVFDNTSMYLFDVKDSLNTVKISEFMEENEQQKEDRRGVAQENSVDLS